MAFAKAPFIRKLKKVLREEFPPPATVTVNDDPGIYGIVTSESFEGLDGMARQYRIEELLKKHFTREERQCVQIIVALTPDQAAFAAAGVH